MEVKRKYDRNQKFYGYGGRGSAQNGIIQFLETRCRDFAYPERSENRGKEQKYRDEICVEFLKHIGIEVTQRRSETHYLLIQANWPLFKEWALKKFGKKKYKPY